MQHRLHYYHCGCPCGLQGYEIHEQREGRWYTVYEGPKHCDPERSERAEMLWELRQEARARGYRVVQEEPQFPWKWGDDLTLVPR